MMRNPSYWNMLVRESTLKNCAWTSQGYIYIYIYKRYVPVWMCIMQKSGIDCMRHLYKQDFPIKKTSQVRWYSFHYNGRARCPHKLFWSQTSACNRSIARTFPLPGAVAATLGSRCCFAVGSADFGEPIASAADWKTDAVDEQNPTNEFLSNSSHWFLGCMPWKKAIFDLAASFVEIGQYYLKISEKWGGNTLWIWYQLGSPRPPTHGVKSNVGLGTLWLC